MRTRNTFVMVVLAIACGAGASAQSYAFRSTWKSPGVKALDMAGKKVAAVMISHDESLRMSVEEAVARELTSRGSVGVAAYRTIPAELLQDPDKARAWFERTGVAGVVVLRLESVDKEKVYSAVVWSTMYYQDFSNYYATGWGTATPIGRAREVTTIAVETLLFDVAKGKLLWGGVTETSNPKSVQTYISGLAGEVAKELRREGLVPK